jgi:phage-related protein (TIGR01555 family)
MSSLLGALMRGMVARADGFMSSITGLGDPNRDKTRSFQPYLDAALDIETCATLFNGGAIGRRVASALPEKALKQGFGLASSNGDMDPKEMQQQAKEVLSDAKRIKLTAKCMEADIWGRVFGFGGIIMGVSGSGTPQDPLDDEIATSLDWIMVVDRREMIPDSYYADPASEKFGEIEFYRIQPVAGFSSEAQSRAKALASLGMTIHETRVVRFGGQLTSRRDRIQNAGCDFSIYQGSMKALQQCENNWDSVCQLMSDMSQGVFSIEGLIKMLAAGNEQALLTRMQALDKGRSTARAIVLDADKEKFERVPTPMSGVDEIMMRSWQYLAATYEMPMTVLWGVSPAGMNATGESDIRLWYDNVQAHRELDLGPPMLRILRLLSKTLGHTAPDSWEITWPSLWQMTAPEQADYRIKTVQADDIEIKNGTSLPEEVALTRYGNGDEFNGGKLQIDVDARKAGLEHAIEDIVNPPDPIVLPPKGLPGNPALGAKPVDGASNRVDEQSRDKDGRFGEGSGAHSEALTQKAAGHVAAYHEAQNANKSTAAKREFAGLVDAADLHAEPGRLAATLRTANAGKTGSAVDHVIADLETKAAGGGQMRVLGKALPKAYRK